MRLTKDHICEIRCDNEYWFDLNRTVFKSELLAMDNSSLVDMICVSFKHIFAIDNRNRALSHIQQKRVVYVSHIIEADILKVRIDFEYFIEETKINIAKSKKIKVIVVTKNNKSYTKLANGRCGECIYRKIVKYGKMKIGICDHKKSNAYNKQILYESSVCENFEKKNSK